MTDFNTIIFYIAMNGNKTPNNAPTENGKSPCQNGDAVFLAKMVRGVSCDDWRANNGARSDEGWNAFPAPAGDDEEELEYGDENLPVSPFREVRGALTSGMFGLLLDRELARLARNGGCLSLISAGVADKERLNTAIGDGAVKRLETLLGVTILDRLERCDSLGILRKGQYVVSFPGMGQLAARALAEKIQTSFRDAARPYFPGGGISAGAGAICALGIVNVPQGEGGEVTTLLKRSRAALELALGRRNSHIHQESPYAPFENTTLVQSNEKRFLFFGGDKS